MNSGIKEALKGRQKSGDGEGRSIILSPLRGFSRFLARNLGLTPQAIHLSPLRGSPTAFTEESPVFNDERPACEPEERVGELRADG